MCQVEHGFALYFHAFVYEICLDIAFFSYETNEVIEASLRKKKNNLQKKAQTQEKCFLWLVTGQTKENDKHGLFSSPSS